MRSQCHRIILQSDFVLWPITSSTTIWSPFLTGADISPQTYPQRRMA
jgi:hypothetical protein